MSQRTKKKQNNTLETWGNETTMNLNHIIYQNILSSPYFRSLFNKKTFHEIVDEIYNEVYVLCPFIKGTQPSTAYCCLFKLWTLRLTVKQIENMIDHVDSPYIRAIGFLYLRYVCAPANLWDWFQYYLEDDEEITISSGLHPTKITIGKFIHMLIKDLKFQDTMLPRIPVPIARDLEKKLQEYHRNNKKNKESSKDDRRYSRERSRSPSKSSGRYSRERSRSPSKSSRRYSRERSRSPSRNDRYRNDRYRSHSRERYRSSSKYRSRSRSVDKRRSDRRDIKDEFDDYERRRNYRSRSKSRDRRDYRRD